MAVGVVLALPGVPGQGLLTMLVGLLLLDIPSKRRLELRIVSRPTVLKTINRVRRRFRRPALLVAPPAKPSHSSEANGQREQEHDAVTQRDS